MVSEGHPKLSIAKQCKLLGIHRSGWYHKPKGETTLNLKLMRLMDEHHLDHIYKGAPSMHTWLTMDKGYKINQKRVDRLFYRVMGLQAVIPGPHTTRRGKDHTTYPYLLRNLEIERVNQVWAIDITYIPMKKGFMYFVAIIDLHSRYVVNWSLSNSMEAEWCQDCLQEAIDLHGKPEILNTDQGSQFTSEIFSQFVLTNGIKLSMDGKGRATDNAFIERLWRTVKYEKIYLNPVNNGHELYKQLQAYFHYYNGERRHTSIDDRHPADVYKERLKVAA